MSEWPYSGPQPHQKCTHVLNAGAAASGMDVDITVRKPDSRGPIQPQGFECPHGILYWIMPTEDQMLDWALKGTP